MTATKEAPYYEDGAYATNSAAFQISQLVRSSADARHLLVPIQEWIDLSDEEDQDDAAEELERLLQSWDRPLFLDHADRAQKILDELDDLWTAGNGVDMMELGERRVVVEALTHAIAQRCEQLKQSP